MMPQIENRCIHRLRLLIDSSNRDAILQTIHAIHLMMQNILFKSAKVKKIRINKKIAVF